MKVQCTLWLGALGIAFGLAGCGGGGGGGSSSGNNTVESAVVGFSGPSTRLTGNVSYDAVPNIDGALSYSATVSKPVRGAAVDVLNPQSGAVLATTTTSDSGDYAVDVPENATVSVRVRAQLLRGGSGPSWNVTVRDNTRSNALYALDSPSFATGTGATRNLHASSGWGGSSYTGERVAGPFAILDTVYTAMGKVLSIAPSTSFSALQVYWSTRNAPANGSVEAGQIGTTGFIGSGTSNSIYVLGLEDSDTDEYDNSVIAHEWGHYYQRAFSRDDSPGGSHDFLARLDQRLAFSEGWGNAWSGIALDRQNYVDSAGPGQSRGVNADLATVSDGTRGWFAEDSIHSILWRLNQRFGFAGIHQAMSGPLRTTRSVTSIHAFAWAYASVQPAAQSELSSLLAAQGVSGAADPWATLESNDGGTPGVLPIYVNASVGAPVRACVTNRNGSGNKLGSFTYVRVQIPSAGTRTISVAGPSNSDPDFDVFAGALLSSNIGLGSSESASVNLPAGDVVVAVNDANDSSANTCFTVQIN